jgi:hypothetical protein
MSIENDQRLAHNLAEVIEETYDVERTRERRIELIAVEVMRAMKIGFRKGRGWRQWQQTS